MEVVPLGVGGAFAKTLNNTNFLIRPAEGDPFLLDCGFTASRALSALGVELERIGSILLSHLHADHIGGLEEFGFCGYFVWGKKTALVLPPGVNEHLWPSSLSGGMGQTLMAPDGSSFDTSLETYFDLRPVGEEPFTVGSVEVTPFEVPHIHGRRSWGFVMHDTATGGRVMFTCDTIFSLENIERYGEGADAIYHDCEFTNGPTIHTPLDKLMTLDEKLQELIMLVHYGDEWRDYEGKTGKMKFAREGEALKF